MRIKLYSILWILLYQYLKHKGGTTYKTEIAAKYLRYIFQEVVGEGRRQSPEKRAKIIEQWKLLKVWVTNRNHHRGWSTRSSRGVPTKTKAPGCHAGDFMPIFLHQQVWRGEADWLMAAGPRHNIAVGPLDFLFPSNAPDEVLREYCRQDTPKGADRKSPERNLSSLTRASGKRQPNRQETSRQ